MSKPVGPVFAYDDYTLLADGTKLYSVHANGRAPLSGGGARYPTLGVYLGRVWLQRPYGWVAAPVPVTEGTEPDSWSKEIDRSHRHFARRKDAALFLYGWRMALGRIKADAQQRALFPSRV